ncbi:MAG: SAM-dependent methyltransferase [Marinifilum sp.]|jgi:hypothetical protein|nr:SAM-dependent methyltransferase [Marinifilum sp.]
MNQELKYSLEQLDMIVDNNHTSGLIPVQGYLTNKDLSPEEIIALENANKYGANYVYFRKFEQRPSVPQIYLYDFTTTIGVEEQELTELHKQLYSSGHVPMFFVFTKQDVRIFNCFERPAEGKELKYSPLTIIKLAASLSQKIDSENQNKFKEFSGKAFDNGTFWENSKYSNHFKFSNSAYEKLLTELKQALKDIIEQDILPEKFARKIMVVSILIKYLEEREDKNGNKVFPKDFFGRFVKNATKFTDILSTVGAYLKLLDYLAKHFNGGIFKLDKTERDFIHKADLTRFGHFLNGDVNNMQFVFWRLYSFNDLPVELISNIYEEFLGKQPGVVYTPPYLVNFLLDEAMPLTNEESDFKILDPACGSGVFLVGAYRRLIYRWRKKNKWKKPDLPTLKKLLKENIFGVELNKDAANLTVFSLSLALCDELTPLEIWKDLKFDNLHEKNILHDDFFNIISSNLLDSNFDLIIGNPPFVQSNLTDAAKLIDKQDSRNRLISYLGKKKQVKLPRNQIALLFLEQCIKMTKKDGLTCLIQPSGPLLYNRSSFEFRKYLLEKYHVPQIVDFSHIARILFGPGGDVPTAAIFVKNEIAKDCEILHITTRRTKTNKEKLFFELDSYDFHKVGRNYALNDPLIWKSNYLGGSRHHQLTLRLKELSTLKEYIHAKSWHYGAGVRVGNKMKVERIEFLSSLGEGSLSLREKEELEELSKKYTNYEDIKEIASMRYLPTEAFTFEGINYSEVGDFPYSYCENFKNINVYSGPHILIKEGISNNRLIAEYTESNLLFKEKIIGIQSDNKDELKKLLRYLKSEIVSYYLAATSAEFLIRRATSVKKLDIDNIPFDIDIGNSFSSYDKILIDDLFNYLIEFRSKGENSYILKTDVDNKSLKVFGEVFCGVLQNVYNSIKPYQHFETESYICYPFYFGDKPQIDFSNSEQAESHIKQLVQKHFGISLRITRILRLYEGNVIYLIKPKKLRYWLKSIALRDADETFSDLRKQGY